MRYPILFLPALLPLSLAAVLNRATLAKTAFDIIAAHSTSPIHLQAVSAVNGSFFIGEGPTSYCPKSSVQHCPSGTSTTLSVSTDGCCSLGKFCATSLLAHIQLIPPVDVLVPGGQQVFVLSSGALGYTSPHSHLIPKGAALRRFTATFGSSPDSLGSFSFAGLGSSGFVACPAANGYGPYKVYAQVLNFKAPNSHACIDFDALTLRASAPGAYEYE